ncbi:hypothetical protein NLG97_g4861 [Lecanicillium saksenae]|uniref:Uncharacterized protein n=1 Tax=Lecanicillium saksenae TaxID=468837 RepID=A0ACC1QVD5_9HYPO|nr:hypothetical protein NLG97_g4861 [Lecanicillium saksenae]
MSRLLSGYGICSQLGFLSSEAPATAFANQYYAEWDSIAAQLPSLLKSQNLAAHIERLPLLSTSYLEHELQYRRAYVVLGFLIHGHVWGNSASGPCERVPPQLGEPFLEVCQELGVSPVLSYSGLVLWNWKVTGAPYANYGKFPDLPNLTSLVSFTGTRGEDAFYHVPVLVEAEGGPLIPLLLQAVAAVETNDIAFVRSALETTAKILNDMGAHLPKLYAVLDADMFYHQLRPFLPGGKGMEEKGLPRGIVFQKSDGSEVEVKCIGGSAAQSSLFPFLDHVLGVEHQEAQSRESVFKEMSSYMPGRHREFLDAVRKHPSLRSFVEKQDQDAAVRVAYNDCMTKLRLWRGKHIAVVSKYIVQPARAASAAATAASGSNLNDEFQSPAGEELQGTGGSSLIPFLKQARDETVGLPLDRK